MSPYSFCLLFFSFCTFFISILIWLKRRDAVGRMYFFFSIFVAVWAFNISFMYANNVSYETILMTARLGNLFSLFIPVSWLLFVTIFIGERGKYRTLITIFYFLALSVVPFVFSQWFIPRLHAVSKIQLYTKGGWMLGVSAFMYYTLVPFSFYLLAKKIKKISDPREKKQQIGFFIATSAGFIGGGFTYPPAWGISVPQYGIYLFPIYPFVMAYFMMRHGLFDLEQIAEAFQREKLATVGLLAASINHEIRNPLYIIKGLTESYAENKREGLPAKNPDEVIDKVSAQAGRILEVIKKLNYFVRPQEKAAGKQAQASIQTAVQTVLDLVSYEFSLDKIQIKNLVSPDVPAAAIDQHQLEEILFNLIVNACQAMLGSATKHGTDASFGAELSVSADNKNKDGFVELRVSDTGCAMAPEQVKHLFEPFRTTKGEKGTGLGLYITKQIIERAGGTIKVETRPGTGTTVVLRLRKYGGRASLML